MINKEDLEKNYSEFKELLKSTGREGIDELINWLDTTDFKVAPASTKYHCDFEGGLCSHSLNVYYTMKDMVDKFYPEKLDSNSIKIVSLLHDLSKTNFYEEYFQNKKLYSMDGKKRDEGGFFDWVTVKSYKIKEPEQRMVAGDHGFNSYLLASKFIKLSDEEITAILNHHMGLDNNFYLKDMNEIYDRYPIAALLHLSDTLTVYIKENKTFNE